MREVFLDASYAIALSNVWDAYHARAMELAEQSEAQQARLVTTRAVSLEIGNALAKMRYRSAAFRLLDALERDANVEVVPLTEELFQRGWERFRGREDKEWGLTDCISFVVMEDREPRDALTADRHFQQAGFRALLIE